MKRLEAFVAAAIITGLVALGMLLIGINALLNTNSVAVSDSPTSTALNSQMSSADSTQAGQYQNLITQYQNREKQYQTQLDQANAQLKQYQQLLGQLQSAGVIQITSDGRVFLNRGGGDGD